MLDADKESWPMKVASTAATLGTPNKSVESVKAMKPEVSFKRKPQATSVDEPAADAVEVSNVVEDRIVGVEDSNLIAAFRGAGAYRGRGGYAHSAMEQTGTFPGSYQPNQQQGPIVPQPGFQPYTGWPQSHSSTPTSSTEMAGYFQDFNSMGAARFGGGLEN